MASGVRAKLVRLLLIGVVGYVLYRLLKGGFPQPAAKPVFKPQLIALERSPYDVLEVKEGADVAQIEAAWQRLIHQNHPDRVKDMGPEIRETAARMTERINEAYETLTAAPDDAD